MIKRIIIVLTIIMMLGILGHYEHHYTRDVVVVDIQNQEVTVEDKQGNLWCFNGTDYTVNQELVIMMFDNHTGTIYDDEIVKIRAPT